LTVGEVALLLSEFKAEIEVIVVAARAVEGEFDAAELGLRAVEDGFAELCRVEVADPIVGSVLINHLVITNKLLL